MVAVAMDANSFTSPSHRGWVAPDRAARAGGETVNRKATELVSTFANKPPLSEQRGRLRAART